MAASDGQVITPAAGAPSRLRGTGTQYHVMPYQAQKTTWATNMDTDMHCGVEEEERSPEDDGDLHSELSSAPETRGTLGHDHCEGTKAPKAVLDDAENLQQKENRSCSSLAAKQ